MTEDSRRSQASDSERSRHATGADVRQVLSRKIVTEEARRYGKASMVEMAIKAAAQEVVSRDYELRGDVLVQVMLQEWPFLRDDETAKLGLHDNSESLERAAAETREEKADFWRCERCGECFNENDGFDKDPRHATHAPNCGDACENCPVPCGPVRPARWIGEGEKS